MCQYPPADPVISASLHHEGLVIHLVVFLISGLGYFIVLYGYAKRNREGGSKEGQTIGLELAPSERGGVCDTFCVSCELTRACTRVKTLKKPLEKLTSVDWSPLCPTIIWLSWSMLPSAYCVLLLNALSCRLFSGTALPSSSSGLVGYLAHKPFLWISCQNRHRDSLTGTHIHTHTTNAQHRGTLVPTSLPFKHS